MGTPNYVAIINYTPANDGDQLALSTDNMPGAHHHMTTTVYNIDTDVNDLIEEITKVSTHTITVDSKALKSKSALTHWMLEKLNSHKGVHFTTGGATTTGIMSETYHEVKELTGDPMDIAMYLDNPGAYTFVDEYDAAVATGNSRVALGWNNVAGDTQEIPMPNSFDLGVDVTFEAVEYLA